MDALRLIRTARHALAEARTVPDVLLEAWQAGLLTEAVGSRIADCETGELAALGQLLCDAGSHAAGCVDQPPDDPAGTGGWSAADWPGGGRAERLGELGALEPVLGELGSLLHEVAETLVVLACGADAEGLYWRCIDGVDSGAECQDLVAELLRTVRRESGTPEPAPMDDEGVDGGPSFDDASQAEGAADGDAGGPADPVPDDPAPPDPSEGDAPGDNAPGVDAPGVDAPGDGARDDLATAGGRPAGGRCAVRLPMLAVRLAPPAGRADARALPAGPVTLARPKVPAAPVAPAVPVAAATPVGARGDRWCQR
ncbi:DUF6099 family protein [Kitasatospora paranensis]|uniref:DUF6099 family protein n=1 Tax=Kitasatospora paranensis TaxID=258053 RepID=A0ABW2FY47_9ACTN